MKMLTHIIALFTFSIFLSPSHGMDTTPLHQHKVKVPTLGQFNPDSKEHGQTTLGMMQRGELPDLFPKNEKGEPRYLANPEAFQHFLRENHLTVDGFDVLTFLSKQDNINLHFSVHKNVWTFDKRMQLMICALNADVSKEPIVWNEEGALLQASDIVKAIAKRLNMTPRALGEAMRQPGYTVKGLELREINVSGDQVQCAQQ